MFFIDTSEPPKIISHLEAFEYTGIGNSNVEWIKFRYKNERGYFEGNIREIFPCSKRQMNIIINMLRTSHKDEAKKICQIISNRLFSMVIIDCDTQYCHTHYRIGGKTGYKQLLNNYKQIREFEKELNYEVQS